MRIRDWFSGIDWAAIVGSAFVLAFGLLVFVPLVGLPQGAHEPQYSDCECTDDYPRHAQPAPPGFIERTITDPVATFTAALALFSLVLTVVSFIQIRFLIRADETTTASAKAAKTAADRLLRVDRPFLLNVGMAPGKIQFGKLPHGYRLDISTRFRNSGTRPGITRSVGLTFAVNALPDTLPPPIKNPNMEFGVLEPDKLAEFELPMNMTELTPKEVADAWTGAIKFFVFGYLRYTDMHGISRRSGFAYRYQANPTVPAEIRFVKTGPEMYWYDLEET